MIKLNRGSGGVHVPGKKELSGPSPIQDAGIPGELVLFLSQHIGAPSVPSVKVGDLVKKGQKIAEPGAAFSAALHAPTSGKVKAIEKRFQPALGCVSEAVVIVPDGEDELFPGMTGVSSSVEDLPREKIAEVAREIGLVGLGGAAFPTAIKLSPPPEKKIETQLLNGAECEPYLTSDQRLMTEHAEDIIFGFKAIMKGIGAKNGIVCIEDNKPEAIEAMKAAAAPFADLETAVLPSIYPTGGEKQLIEKVTGKEVPPPPGLPLDVGVCVSNVGTAYALAQGIKEGFPLIERVVTVTGEGVNNPGNYRVLVGTPVSYLIEKAGGFKGVPGKVIMGGPMMGFALKSTDVPVMKGTSGIVVLPRESTEPDKVLPCVKCGKCVDVCPMRLMPIWIAAYSENGYIEDAEKMRAMDCIECGSCSYECPSKRPLVQYIKLAKAEISARRRAATQGGN